MYLTYLKNAVFDNPEGDEVSFAVFIGFSNFANRGSNLWEYRSSWE
jgi:hypothetical protein